MWTARVGTRGVRVTTGMLVRMPREFPARSTARTDTSPGGGLGNVTDHVPSDATFNSNRIPINTFALNARLPTMHGFREFVEAGGLMCYAPNYASMFRRAAEYVDKILRGAKPADMPFEQPTKFDLVINLKTAKAIGLKIPESFLVRADEVIE